MFPRLLPVALAWSNDSSSMVCPIPLHGTREKEKKKEKRKENTFLTMESTRQAAFSLSFSPYAPSFILGILPRRDFVLASPSPLSHRPGVGFRVDPTFIDLDTNIILFGTAVRGGIC